MIDKIIFFSIKNKFLIGLFTLALIAYGLYSLKNIPLGAVPDITNNQVQVITTAPNLSTTDIEQFVTYPVELAMGNLPGVTEIRSISRFGLSVVTIVFEEDMGTYLPRQLVSEKLTEVREEIPEDFGQPTMGPISTGLGEIYQYYLKVAPEYDSLYTDRKLRTIQDWIIKRQMAMLPGVVEVNSFGGHIKQYEVAVNPERLRRMGITLTEIYQAVNQNNGNTGGAYIEKNHRANFIRGEGLISTLDELKKVVVKTTNDIPILLKDVAKVQLGSAVRYGAFTRDGKGEAVGGIVMMLKDANPDKVIGHIKERMGQIQKSLPPGVQIEPFLDRSKLIDRTTHTIGKNLIEGALIVIFVLVLLLGNFRGGLIVASVIPLSLLFAFIMMRLFGVSANLMSLGAIDFGILVDGAVIIVEGTVFAMHRFLRKDKAVLTPAKMDTITYSAGSKMMHSAFFGQLIILIVFLPILTLEGIEGKMFKPMALTFSFAVLGAMILCLTYIPMVTSLFLSGRKKRAKPNFIERISKKLMNGIEKVYSPVIHWSLKRWKSVLAIAVLLLLIAGFTFSRMGSVFIPKLDEGTIAMQVLLRPGTSLSETVKTSTKVENILLGNFPEVEHVMARIGVSEIPTDPMPMDIADMFILLKPEKEWTSAENKEELIAQFKEKLEVLPGVNFQFSQPVELRFNELLTGVKEDLAIKIYGHDLEVLAQKADELAGLVGSIDGVGDLSVEATQGLPQITIDYDRNKIARYGLNVQELNGLVEMAYAGKSAGQVFEGAKRFDIVLRLEDDARKRIAQVKNLFVPTPNGTSIPLAEVAHISYQPGPMQISRDGTNRRVSIGINVRGRDVESLVKEIQTKLDSELSLPPGYYVTYGGEFENLQRAQKRLGIVVPIALVLIYLLLYFALKSFRQSAMIYVAIPLSAIGGIFSLYFRGIPFSISAGIGFIVLFGVAVLNGLVLVNSFNELKENGVTALRERIYRGTMQRLRPVLLTAIAAIMGFVPMALSTSAGAEVQRPLATVVIGGLITATLLTLVVIPVLYYLTERKNSMKLPENPSSSGLKPILVLLIFISGFGFGTEKALAQEAPVSTDTIRLHSLAQAEALAMKNSPGLMAAELNIKKRQQLERTGFDLPKTRVFYGKEEFGNHAPGIASYGIEQEFVFPTVYGKRSRLLDAQTQLSLQKREISESQVRRQVRISWYNLQNAYRKQQLYTEMDRLYGRFVEAAKLRYKTGETDKLALLSAKGKRVEIKFQLKQSQSAVRSYRFRLKQLVSADKPIAIDFDKGGKAKPRFLSVEKQLGQSSLLRYQTQKIEVSMAQTRLEKAKLWPSLSAEFALQTINDQSGFYAFQVGIAIPLAFGAQKGRIEAAKTQAEIDRQNLRSRKIELESRFHKLLARHQNLVNVINYYESDGLQLMKALRNGSSLAYEKGEIGYVEYIQGLDRLLALKSAYIEALDRYNQTSIELNYLLNK